MKITYPNGSVRDQSRDWMLDQLGAGSQTLRLAYDRLNNGDLTAEMEQLMELDPDYWNGDD
jgi:hypothetical protein